MRASPARASARGERGVGTGGALEETVCIDDSIARADDVETATASETSRVIRASVSRTISRIESILESAGVSLPSEALSSLDESKPNAVSRGMLASRLRSCAASASEVITFGRMTVKEISELVKVFYFCTTHAQ